MLIEKYLEVVVKQRGSDLHISAGLPPVIRVDGNYYVNTGEKVINIGGFFDTYKIWCSVYKLFDDCQRNYKRCYGR